MFHNVNIGRKLIVAIGGSVGLVLGIFGIIAVSQYADLVSERTRNEAKTTVATDALRIQAFLVEHGRVVITMLANDDLIGWFQSRDSKEESFLDDPAYSGVVGFFDNIVNAHESIKNAFFGVDQSNEYFANHQPELPQGRLEIEGYIIHQRPWWKNTLAQDRLYAGSPSIDISNGDIALVIQTTVYRNGSLVGIGGVDILINTVRDIVNQLSYRGEGHAFLIDNEGVIITFADLEITGDTLKLEDLDAKDGDGAGFAKLQRIIKKGDKELPTVLWRGHEWRVAYAPVQADLPYVEWTLGLLVPEELISGPVRKSILGAGLLTLLAVFIVSALTLSLARTVVTQPIRQLAHGFDDIASGRGDLTRRVEVTSGDEIGRLGTSFNNFVETIQQNVSAVGGEADSLTQASKQLLAFSERLANDSDKTAEQAAMVSSSASQVSDNVNAVASATEQLNASTREIATNASEAAAVASEAVQGAQRTDASFSRLHDSGTTIADMVSVIYSIAEQTNLLALNATIEAARAGDAGKGFAVVAEEVKSLAKETASATEKIRETASSIGESTIAAGETITSICATIDRIHDIQTIIAGAVEEQTSATAEIARSINEAAAGVSEIAARISEIAAAAQSTTEGSNEARNAADEYARLASSLQSIVGRFTY